MRHAASCCSRCAARRLPHVSHTSTSESMSTGASAFGRRAVVGEARRAQDADVGYPRRSCPRGRATCRRADRQQAPQRPAPRRHSRLRCARSRAVPSASGSAASLAPSGQEFLDPHMLDHDGIQRHSPCWTVVWLPWIDCVADDDSVGQSARMQAPGGGEVDERCRTQLQFHLRRLPASSTPLLAPPLAQVNFMLSSGPGFRGRWRPDRAEKWCYGVKRI